MHTGQGGWMMTFKTKLSLPMAYIIFLILCIGTLPYAAHATALDWVYGFGTTSNEFAHDMPLTLPETLIPSVNS
jgi:hypothetical protein